MAILSEKLPIRSPNRDLDSKYRNFVEIKLLVERGREGVVNEHGKIKKVFFEKVAIWQITPPSWLRWPFPVATWLQPCQKFPCTGP
jgi:hypothetical protein